MGKTKNQGKRQKKTTSPRGSLKKRRALWKPKLITNWLFYSTENRQRIREEYPENTFGDHTKALSKEWNSLTEEEKSPYTRRQQDTIKAYHTKMANLSAEERKELQSVRRANRKARLRERERLESLGLGQFPISDYLMFSEDNRSKFQGLPFKDIGKALGRAWRKCKTNTPDLYESYRARAGQYRKEYLKKKRMLEKMHPLK
jgi:hypothetical protein